MKSHGILDKNGISAPFCAALPMTTSMVLEKRWGKSTLSEIFEDFYVLNLQNSRSVLMNADRNTHETIWSQALRMKICRYIKRARSGKRIGILPPLNWMFMPYSGTLQHTVPKQSLIQVVEGKSPPGKEDVEPDGGG